MCTPDGPGGLVPSIDERDLGDREKVNERPPLPRDVRSRHGRRHGEVRQEFSVCFLAPVIDGKPRQDNEETKAAKWLDVANLAELDIQPSMRRRIDATEKGA